MFINQGSDSLAEDVVDCYQHLTGPWLCVLDDCGWIEWAGVILTQRELPGKIHVVSFAQDFNVEFSGAWVD